MHPLQLHNSTGNAQVDQVVQGIIGIFETVFPARIRGYYIEGSYAEGSGLATSDVDLIILFKDDFQNQAEQHTAGQLARYCSLITSIELDIEIVDEKELAAGVMPSFILGSIPVYGEDVRATFPLLSIEEWTRNRMHSAYWLMNKVFKRPPIVHYPITYPDPYGEFYGYDNRTVRLSSGISVNSTRNLVRVTGWAATALIALKAKQYVARKRDCHVAYRKYINDEWTQLLEDIYAQCHTKWSYMIPADAVERQQLRIICENTLRFENHFLAHYKGFLLAELQTNDDNYLQRLIGLLDEVTYDDPDVLAALQTLTNAENQKL